MTSQQPAVSLKEFCAKANYEKYLKFGKDLATKNVGKSFSLLSFGLALNSSKKEEYYQLYVKVFESWSNKLIESGRVEDALKIFEVAHDLYPESKDLDYLLSCTLYRLGKTREAWECAVKTLNRCRCDPRVRDLVCTVSNCLVDRWHFPMLNDRTRNEAYRDAIRGLAGPGRKTVLDIGSGSAILSIYARECGFETFACERDEFIFEMAGEVLKVNGRTEVVLLNVDSNVLKIPADIPERVGLVVTETFDSGLFGEQSLQSLKYAWEHLLLPPADEPTPASGLPRPAPTPASGVLRPASTSASGLPCLASTPASGLPRPASTPASGLLRPAPTPASGLPRPASTSASGLHGPVPNPASEIPIPDLGIPKLPPNPTSEIPDPASEIPVPAPNLPSQGDVIRVLPLGSEVWISICESGYIARQIRLVGLEDLKGTNVYLNPGDPYLSENVNKIPGNFRLLADWTKVLDVDLNSLSDINKLMQGARNSVISLRLKGAGRADGIIMAYKLIFPGNSAISTFPGSGSCWENAIFPVYESNSFCEGDEILVDMKFEGVLRFSLLPGSGKPSFRTGDSDFVEAGNTGFNLGSGQPSFRTGDSEFVEAGNTGFNLGSGQPSFRTGESEFVEAGNTGFNLGSGKPSFRTGDSEFVEAANSGFNLGSGQPSFPTGDSEFVEAASTGFNLGSGKPSFRTGDSEFVRAGNSRSYREYYRGTAEEAFLQNDQRLLTVLDDCPFPEGGLTLLKLNPQNEVFVNNETALRVLGDCGYSPRHGKDSGSKKFDVIFCWPFSPEGTLKDNLFAELLFYRRSLSKGGRIYPKYLNLNMLGMESFDLEKMTKVNDANTLGVKVAEVLNLSKTLHQLDIPIEGLNYKPLTNVLNPMKLQLNEAKIIAFGSTNKRDQDDEFLHVGGSLTRSSIKVEAKGQGIIHGFAYWFELTNCEYSSSIDTSSESDCDLTCQKRPGPFSASNPKETVTFDSSSRDSPINQCVLLIDDPTEVQFNQLVNFNFAMSENHFSVQLIE